jgi:hypothetical protein
METVFMIGGGLVALNVALPIMLLNRRPRPHLRHRLLRWVMGDQPPARPRRLVHALVVAHRHHH